MNIFLSLRDLYTRTSSQKSRCSNQRRKLCTDDFSPSKRSSLVRMLPIVSIICIILSTSFATSNAFVPSTTSQTTRITSRTTAKLTKTTRAGTTSNTQLGIAKSGGKMIETEKQFAETVLSKDLSRPVLVFFTAPWCGPCRLTVPVVKDVMKQYSGELDVVEVCTDDLAEVAENSGVVSIPTIQFYYDGTALETHSIVGCVAKSVLSNAVQKVIEDVAQIRQTNKR